VFSVHWMYMKPSNTLENTKSKKKYQVNNWREYNQALKQRGSITIWIPDDIQERWYVKKGRETYSDEAIQIVASLKAAYSQPWRQAEGLARSVFDTAGIPLTVPDYSTLSRRSGNVKYPLRVRNTKDSVHLILDSTGAKITGEGEWKTRKHGWSKRRRWKKVHIGINADGEIVSIETTDNDTHDAAVLHNILDGITEDIASFFGDGAYDHRAVYDALRARGVSSFLIPPRKDAKIWIHGNSSGPPHPRDENLRAIRRSTRRRWKEDSGYHTRSLGETVMYRFKTTFGGRLSSQKHENQQAEVRIKCRVLNVFHSLGMPETVVVATPP